MKLIILCFCSYSLSSTGCFSESVTIANFKVMLRTKVKLGVLGTYSTVFTILKNTYENKFMTSFLFTNPFLLCSFVIETIFETCIYSLTNLLYYMYFVLVHNILVKRCKIIWFHNLIRFTTNIMGLSINSRKKKRTKRRIVMKIVCLRVAHTS